MVGSKTKGAMVMKHISADVRRNWRALLRDRRANVALTFGITFIPVVALVGAAVDYSRANSTRVALQAALDSTALMPSATIRWGTNRLRVALVLDNTGSMKDDGKMDALKKATNDLLDTLKTAAVNKEDVYVSIVPFSRSINVGKANATANWIDWSLFDTKSVVNPANG